MATGRTKTLGNEFPLYIVLWELNHLWFMVQTRGFSLQYTTWGYALLGGLCKLHHKPCTVISSALLFPLSTHAVTNNYCINADCIQVLLYQC